MLVDCAASHLALQQRISHREDHDGTVDWQGFLERAYGRSARPTIPLLDLEDFQPSPQDALWELRCTVGPSSVHHCHLLMLTGLTGWPGRERGL